MVQEAKGFAAKLDDLNLIPRTHREYPCTVQFLSLSHTRTHIHTERERQERQRETDRQKEREGGRRREREKERARRGGEGRRGTLGVCQPLNVSAPII